MEPEAKRKRSSNFTPNEKSVLYAIVSQYKHIIENKGTDAVTTNEKNETWENIAAKFNAKCPSTNFRSAASLRKCYENAKKAACKSAAEDRKQTYLTGGGCKTISVDKNEELLLSVMNNKTVHGLQNPFDNDHVIDEESDPSEEEKIASNGVKESIILEICPDSPQAGCNDWGKYSAKDFSKEISEALQFEREQGKQRRLSLQPSNGIPSTSQTQLKVGFR
jgi:hypothetical protein